MSESKEIVRKFFDTMCSGDFEGGFAGMTVDATWSVIGTHRHDQSVQNI